jgi:hypothetical protein
MSIISTSSRLNHWSKRGAIAASPRHACSFLEGNLTRPRVHAHLTAIALTLEIDVVVRSQGRFELICLRPHEQPRDWDTEGQLDALRRRGAIGAVNIVGAVRINESTSLFIRVKSLAANAAATWLQQVHHAHGVTCCDTCEASN